MNQQNSIVEPPVQYRVGTLQVMAMEHWQAHQPMRWARLVKEGRLEAVALQAAKDTQEEMLELLPGSPERMDWMMAWEAVREKQILTPPETVDEDPVHPVDGAYLELGMELQQQAYRHAMETVERSDEDSLSSVRSRLN